MGLGWLGSGAKIARNAKAKSKRAKRSGSSGESSNKGLYRFCLACELETATVAISQALKIARARAHTHTHTKYMNSQPGTSSQQENKPLPHFPVFVWAPEFGPG